MVNNPYKELSKVNPQRENGHREIANDIWHAIMRAGLSGAQYQIVFAVIDHTWGFQEKNGHIPLSQFVIDTGLSKQGIVDALNELDRKRIIVRVKAGAGRPTRYLFNKHYDTWLTSKQTLTSKQELTELVNSYVLGSQQELTRTSQLPTSTTEPLKKKRNLLKKILKKKKENLLINKVLKLQRLNTFLKKRVENAGRT